MNTLRNTVVSLVLGATSLAAFAGDNLLVNGDFEGGTTAAPVFNANYGFYTSYPVGWTDQGNNQYRYGYTVYEGGAKVYPGSPVSTTTAPMASSGTHLLAVGTYLAGTGGVGGLTQNVTVSPGSLLTLSYDYQLYGTNGVSVDVIDLSNKQVIATNLLSQGTNQGWTSMAGTFNAATGLLQVRIHANNWSPDMARSYLDKVKLTAAVPEASSWSMMGLGLLGLFGLGRKQRQARTA